ncbi:hypothetical protein CC78DRAFT_44395 [Lojkania enalia]|uniref:Uncharacterized protein n=1 Tax=Lojkania enalia TaxID=147567 RepID=A0A9P4N2M6_9PLEO|nr:hypothetical protein CC78DRAFT_44395 [Didymosphaeria enalia]
MMYINAALITFFTAFASASIITPAPEPTPVIKRQDFESFFNDDIKSGLSELGDLTTLVDVNSLASAAASVASDFADGIPTNGAELSSFLSDIGVPTNGAQLSSLFSNIGEVLPTDAAGVSSFFSELGVNPTGAEASSLLGDINNALPTDMQITPGNTASKPSGALAAAVIAVAGVFVGAALL